MRWWLWTVRTGLMGVTGVLARKCNKAALVARGRIPTA